MKSFGHKNGNSKETVRKWFYVLGKGFMWLENVGNIVVEYVSVFSIDPLLNMFEKF